MEVVGCRHGLKDGDWLVPQMRLDSGAQALAVPLACQVDMAHLAFRMHTGVGAPEPKTVACSLLTARMAASMAACTEGPFDWRCQPT